MANVPLIINQGTINNLATDGRVRTVASPDTRNVNTNPQDYVPGMTCDFKTASTVGISAVGTGYVGLITFRPYGSSTDFSGGPVWQLAFLNDGQFMKRYSTGGTTWSAWTAV